MSRHVPVSRSSRRAWQQSAERSIGIYWEHRHDHEYRAYVADGIKEAKFYRDYKFWYERAWNTFTRLLMLKPKKSRPKRRPTPDTSVIQ